MPSQIPTSSCSRRRFLAGTAAAAAGLAAPAFSMAETTPASQQAFGRDWSKIRGFNYQPSYGSSGLELWQKFDEKTIEIELGRGRRFFPGMNALRWWQSWDTFLRDPDRYARNFDQTLDLADKAGCSVMPVLFNR